MSGLTSITQIKSLKDVRTIISTHSRSTPRIKGSTYLEVYLLDKEKQRLETELATLTKRQKRIEERLGENRKATDKLVSQAQEGESPSCSPISTAGESQTPGGCGSAPPNWKVMPVEY